jgi:hypothetical protein
MNGSTEEEEKQMCPRVEKKSIFRNALSTVFVDVRNT